MIKKDIRIEGKIIQAISIKLNNNNLILLKGNKGYVMCSYLNMEVANKLNDIAVKITGVSTIEEALIAEAKEISKKAESIGVYKSQSVSEILKLIA